MVLEIMASEKDEVDKDMEICAILSKRTLTDIEAMTLGEYKELKKLVSFVYSKPPVAKARQTWKRYRFIYDIAKINTGMFVSVQYFLAGGIEKNLHNLAACIVKPLFGKYDAKKHEKYANDLKDAPLVYILSSMLFFCELFKNTLLAMALEANKKNPTPEGAKALTLLKSNLDGLYM